MYRMHRRQRSLRKNFRYRRSAGPSYRSLDRACRSRRQYSAVRTFGLLAYGLLYGAYIFIGANGLQNHLTRLFLLLDLAVGLVVACTIYGFYALFSRGRI